MELKEAILARHSTRGYLPTPVPQDVLKTVLELGTRAVSAQNTQPWKFAVVTGELLDKIAAYLLKKETITGQEMMAIIEGRDPELVDNYGATREEEPKLFRPSVPDVIEPPARNIHIVSEPPVAPMPDEEEPAEAKSEEEKPE